MKGCVSEGGLSGKRQWSIQLRLKYLTFAHFTKTYDHENTFLESTLGALNWAYVSKRSFSLSFISFMASVLMNIIIIFSHTFLSFPWSSQTLILDLLVYFSTVLGQGGCTASSCISVSIKVPSKEMLTKT